MKDGKHKKKRAKHLSDWELIEYFKQGVLTLSDLRTPDPTLWRELGEGKRRQIKATKIPNGKNTPGFRYRFDLQINGSRRTIVRAKCVWMYVCQYPIPDGLDIHHIDGDRHNDAIHNLTLMSAEDHIALHNQKTREKTGEALLQNLPDRL